MPEKEEASNDYGYDDFEDVHSFDDPTDEEIKANYDKLAKQNEELSNQLKSIQSKVQSLETKKINETKKKTEDEPPLTIQEQRQLLKEQLKSKTITTEEYADRLYELGRSDTQELLNQKLSAIDKAKAEADRQAIINEEINEIFGKKGREGLQVQGSPYHKKFLEIANSRAGYSNFNNDPVILRKIANETDKALGIDTSETFIAGTPEPSPYQEAAKSIASDYEKRLLERKFGGVKPKPNTEAHKLYTGMMKLKEARIKAEMDGRRQ